MKKKEGLDFLKLFDLLYAAFFCTGLLLSVNCCFRFLWPPILLLVSAAAFQGLLVWSEEKGLRIQVWGGAALLVVLFGCYWNYSGKNMDSYFYYLGMEGACFGASVLCYVTGYG